MSSNGEASAVVEGQGLIGSKAIVGEVWLRRVGFFRFPVWELVNEGKTLARLGRSSAWSIYFGFGQKVQFVDGTLWRVRSVESSGMISAVVLNSDGLKVALGSIGPSGYLIVGKDFSYRLLHDHPNRVFLPTEWTLSSDGVTCAEVQRQPLRVTAATPIPAAAVVISIALVRVGILGGKKMAFPSVQWTKSR